MRKLAIASLLTLPILLSLGCAGRKPYPTVDELALDTVVLYRNGIGYFERHGKVDDDILRLKVRKDQVNDLLKSLTVVDRDGKAVSVSMPLDPAAWANAAMATLAPGRGSLAQVLDSMRGTEVSVRTHGGRVIRGRIVMVERSVNEPDPSMRSSGNFMPPPSSAESLDWKLTVLAGGQMQVVRLSKVTSVTLHDGDLAMALNRSLDASAGEGMFEQVEIEVRLAGARTHELTVSYVVAAPMWKPTYRVVLPKDGKGDSLLQGWAVVDNISGEDWSEISLSLTSGAPIAFRYDLHTPRDVYRSDMTESGVHKQAAVAVGETTWTTDEAQLEGQVGQGTATGAASPYGGEADGYWDELAEEESVAHDDKPRDAKKAERPNAAPPPPSAGPRSTSGADMGPSLDLESLQRSTAASTRSERISGLTRVDLTTPVTVPDGTSTMVAIINERIAAEETFLYKPGGAGYGYEANPYRVVRFENSTEYVLEPGPISIYSGGSFVGEGLSEAVGAGTSVTIPFAVEPGILITSSKQYAGQEMKVTRIVRGVLEVESFYQTTTTWDVRGPANPNGFKVLIRQPQSGSNYQLAQRPEGTEDLEGAWLIPVTVPPNKTSATLAVVEQTPSNISIAIWDQQAIELLEKFLAADNLDEAARKKLQPIVDLRREIGRIDTEVEGLRRQQAELEQRAEQTRRNLEAIKKDPAATGLRQRLNTRLEEFSTEADAAGRKIVELESKRLEKKIELEDMIQDLDLRAPMTPGKDGPKPKAGQ
ncbi:MAG TPA: DUF4139 domain-containing protein [Enhygromyxa sp.]|nr:DUF4139 domain-containing protein [Enhygromyxa sp.]